MTYVSIDGDDIGQRVAAKHLANDSDGLSSFVKQVQEKVILIERLLIESGYRIIFCAADGVVAQIAETDTASLAELYVSIQAIGGRDLTFSAGVGWSLREAYIALLAAKSNGKDRICIFSEML
ncbi:mCpol domain-containing protein [Methylobacterium sp. WL116]|uniref:mCpol domain-containing protein n=1 Tax=Methylobacterium sp. WL116 TaxID=2603889 RepID=UPI0011CA8270|nr:mCpol domain-containing protein [Methylobacterium sp. WL116]TXM95369.1 mCpol domain-containing protein [Methylobacterium sp. WL116]